MQYLLLYLIVAGIYSFTIFGVDKLKATKQKWRVSEKHLLWSVALGGWIGAVIGMNLFRHKTIKTNFLWKFRLLVGVWIIITILAMIYIK